jgi:hypothetical protein
MNFISESGQHLYVIADRNLKPDLVSYLKDHNFAHVCLSSKHRHVCNSWSI